MNTEITSDVLIVGAGPAGLAAAISTLLYTGLSVTVIESSALDALKIGENVSRSIFDLLTYLDIPARDVESCLIGGYASLAAWGSEELAVRTSIFSALGQSYQLNRDEFDHLLLKKAAGLGAKIIPRCRCNEINQLADGHWEVNAIHQEKGIVNINARYLVDATGRQAHICRKLGQEAEQDDRLTAVGTFFRAGEGSDLVQETWLETTENGWWYYSVLPERLVSVTFFSDADIISSERLNTAEKWQEQLHKTKYIGGRLRDVACDGDLWVRNAFSRLNCNYSRKNFLSVGDAALATDPLSSMGIGFALTSGCNGARAILADYNGERQAISNYQNTLADIYDSFTKAKAQYYAAEKRWPDAPFWHRRNTA